MLWILRRCQSQWTLRRTTNLTVGLHLPTWRRCNVAAMRTLLTMTEAGWNKPRKLQLSEIHSSKRRQCLLPDCHKKALADNRSLARQGKTPHMSLHGHKLNHSSFLSVHQTCPVNSQKKSSLVLFHTATNQVMEDHIPRQLRLTMTALHSQHYLLDTTVVIYGHALLAMTLLWSMCSTNGKSEVIILQFWWSFHFCSSSGQTNYLLIKTKP